ncbi:site-specific DNA recombinase [Cerasibacillus quisquiliarum]|uniref:Resolvase n=1 Tax=Cerasibacillus quisquiliarum TaxID=227865 RepID=A0A511UX34_9BACI|nr:recombinase family protein [Cerasibacillus quisquiliarum]MBB5146497.1 site-specific DNA recombinase [Cerasibacillus quisquiliarum]GEN31196.1 resolvase [Cerasibacillus quisquiliarum]
MDISRVAIYARVSTEEQAKEGFSIAAQLQTLRQYAQIYNWEVIDEYVDEGISGKSVKGRPEMKRLIKDVENERFDAVIVWKISRLSRNMLETLMILDKFEKYNVKFISYSENFDTSSPIGRLVLQIMASIAEMERNTLAENVKLGMKQRALEGRWNGGVVFGYDTVKKELVINEKEAEVVQLIYHMYANGKGLRAISNHLNKAGYKTKRNRYFSINGVAQILDNVIYNGKISWLKFENWDSKRRKGKNPNPILVEGKHEPIISDELWSVVRARRKSKSFKQRQSNEPFLISQLLRCPDCGQGMVPSITTYTRKDGTKRKHRYYVCSDFHNKGSAACKANSIKAYEAEDTVIKRIQQFCSNKKKLYKTLTEISSTSAHAIKRLNIELEEIEKQLKEIEQLQAKYMEAFEKNTLPIDILQERLQKVSDDKRGFEQRKNEVIMQLGSIDSKVIQPDLIEKLLKKFLSVYKKTSRENKKQLLQLLINNISIKQIDKSRTIKNIELEFDFTELNISKTFILIHLLYRETDNEHTFSIPASDKELPPYLQKFLPLFVVRFPLHNLKPPINLL